VRHVLKEVVITAPRRPLTNISSRSEDFLDSTLRTALVGLNALRHKLGLKPYFASPRFRLIREPRFTAGQIELDLAPIDFVYRAMLEEESVDESVKEHVRIRIQETARRIPKRLHSIHPTLNGLNYHPLGVEIAIITKDGRTLLRRRGENVLLSRLEWDVSFSGYCGEKDRIDGGELEIALTAQHELQREIGFWRLIPGISYLPAFIGMQPPGRLMYSAFGRYNLEPMNLLNCWPTNIRASSGHLRPQGRPKRISCGTHQI